MRRHLHHLNALRCFEAAARLLSFTQAAAELHVTQAAISHQVRALEEALGQPLFERRPRQVRLTPAGERLVGVLSSSFDRIDELRAASPTTAFVGAYARQPSCDRCRANARAARWNPCGADAA